jgi:hypothetical protein
MVHGPNEGGAPVTRLLSPGPRVEAMIGLLGPGEGVAVVRGLGMDLQTGTHMEVHRALPPRALARPMA